MLVEASSRFATGYDGEQTRVEVSEIVEAMSTGVPDPGRNATIESMQVGALGLHPYLGFAQRYLISSHSREIALANKPQPENEYRIMILGGSVAGGFGNKTSAGVGELRKALEADPRFAGREIRFIPQGHGSFKQPQQLNLANYLLASGVKPHAIVNLDGFNEVVLALENAAADMNPTYPSYSQWVHLASDWGIDTNTMIDALLDIRRAKDEGREFGSWALNLGLHHSSLFGQWVLERMRSFKKQHDQASRAYVRLLLRRPSDGALTGPEFRKGEEFVLRGAVRMWSESSRALRALCEEHGIFYLHVLQPTLHDIGAKVVTRSERRKGQASEAWMRGARIGYPLLRDAGHGLIEQGVAYVDASKVFASIETDLYYDACHFNQEGNAILGRWIAESLLAKLPMGELRH